MSTCDENIKTCSICFDEILSDNDIFLKMFITSCGCYKHNSFHENCFKRSQDTMKKKCIICREEYISDISDVNSNPRKAEYYTNAPEDVLLYAIKHNAHILKYISNQTEKICLEAIKKDFHSLQHIKDQTLKICLEAIKQDGRALQYIREQTPEMCFQAIEQNSHHLQYVKNQTYDLCKKAVFKDGSSLHRVRDKENRTDELCFEAFRKSYYAKHYMSYTEWVRTCILHPNFNFRHGANRFYINKKGFPSCRIFPSLP